MQRERGRRTGARGLIRSVSLGLAVGLFIVSLFVSRPLHAETPQTDVSELVADPKYRFCNESGYRLFRQQKDEFCPVSASVSKRCPALAKACTLPPWDDEQAEDSSNWHAPQWAEGLFELLFWLLLGAGLLWLLVTIVRNTRSQLGDFRPHPAPAGDVVAPAREPLPEFATKSPQEHLEDGRRLLGEGKLEAGLLALYWACLQALATRGWIRLRRSFTTGDYARTLRQVSASALSAETSAPPSTVQAEASVELLRSLDGARFGKRATREELDALLHWVTQLVQQLALLALTLLTTGCDPSTVLPESPTRATSPSGHLLFEELLARRAPSFKKHFAQLDAIAQDTNTVVVHAAQLTQLEWKVIDRWVQSGGNLVQIGASPAFRETFEIESDVEECCSGLQQLDAPLARPSPVSVLSQSGLGYSLLQCGSRDHIVEFHHGAGWVTLLVSDELTQNALLIDADTANFLSEVVDVGSATIEYLGPTARGARSPIQSLVRGQFGWWLLHVLVAFAVAAWGLGARFGRPLPPMGDRRRAFVEHALAQARQYENIRATGWTLARYAEWVHERLRRSGPRGVRLRAELEREFREAARDEDTAPSPETRGRHLAIFRKLRSSIGG